MTKVDIIGGSLSGLSTAISIKEHNRSINVVVYEKHKKIGYNHEGRRCGEAHTIEKEWSKWIPEKNSYYNEIKTGLVYLGEKKYKYTTKPGTAYILNRQEFICQLARKAEKLGVIIQTNHKIKSKNDLESDYIIDASGCPSTIKRELNLNKGLKGVTYQHTIEDSNCFISDTIKIYYIGEFGYYWIFPRNPEKKEVNVGIGFVKNFGYSLKNLLEEFEKKQKITGKINYVTGGLLPIGLQRPFKYKNILFVGDASAGTFPPTGQGIYRALLSGDAAGKCIAHNQVNRYPYMLNKMFIKWDVILKFFTSANLVCRNINPNLVIKNFEYLFKFGVRISH
ncbi:MAG: NAD(P)/FAD-dependent oxidoreductase [Candidatus Thermoplasmatota archaeon]|nr:NAD(P)/FAD-dependent oxidoreductase [Candidatus Thermoplasmatota archaeon]